MPHRPPSPPVDTTSRGNAVEHHYRRDLHELQIELVKFQRRLIACGDRVLVPFEGRDAAGKDGVIKHVVEHLSPRENPGHGPARPDTRTADGLVFSALPTQGDLAATSAMRPDL